MFDASKALQKGLLTNANKEFNNILMRNIDNQDIDIDIVKSLLNFAKNNLTKQKHRGVQTHMYKKLLEDIKYLSVENKKMCQQSYKNDRLE